MNTLPEEVTSLLLAVFVVGGVVLVLVPAAISLWRISRAPLREVREIYSPPEESIGAIVGLIFIDLALYFLFRASLSQRFFYSVLAGINIMFLTFVAYNVLSSWVAARRFRKLTTVPAMIEE